MFKEEEEEEKIWKYQNMMSFPQSIALQIGWESNFRNPGEFKNRSPNLSGEKQVD